MTISKSLVKNLHNFIELELKSYFSKDDRVRNLTEISKKLNISRGTTSKYVKMYLINKHGEMKGMKIYNEIWHKNTKPYTYNELRELARRRGLKENTIEGKLITSRNEFEILIQHDSPSQVKLRWWCGINEHEVWETNVSEVKRGTWCPTCSKLKKSFNFIFLIRFNYNCSFYIIISHF